MNTIPTTDRSTEINDLHNGIVRNLRTSVSDAVRIGHAISLQKAELEYGEFISWIEKSVVFSYKTAEKYMKLHRYSDRIESSSNLSLAYKKVEGLEALRRRAQKSRVKNKVGDHRKTGTKPRKKDDREVYDEYRKQEEEKAYKERLAEAFAEPEEPKKGSTAEGIQNLLDDAKDLMEKNEKQHRLNLATYADTANQSSMFAAIEQYINSFPDVSRQLEATHNLIKKLKDITNELQRASI